MMDPFLNRFYRGVLQIDTVIFNDTEMEFNECGRE